MGRSVFYNNSAFDGKDPTAGPADDAAIATDKSALLPGGVAQFSNLTSYAKGLNGLMIDLAGAPGLPSAADFDFAVGNDAVGATWAAVSAPPSMLVRADPPAPGVTRVEFTWPDNTIVNQWLRVTVKADAATGLGAPDVFYFGNLIGSSGEQPLSGLFVVSAADTAAVQADPHGVENPAAVTNAHDYNRDRLVDAVDALIPRYGAAGYTTLARMTAPPAVAPTVSPVVGRYVFYNNTMFDGFDPAAGPADDAAIDASKRPLLPGSFAQFPCITNYAQGINGLMIDIAGTNATAAQLSDFGFAVGNSTTPSQWTTVSPAAMLVRPGAGAGGTTRIEFTWANRAIVNTWLQVTVRATPATGLTAPDVFYFGNLVGFSTGTTNASATKFVMKADDLAYVADDPHSVLNPAPVTNPHDFNRDGRVDAIDQLIARYNTNLVPAPSLANLDFTGLTWSLPLVITRGGTYSGNWQSLDVHQPAVAISTTEPVVITNSVVRGMDDLIVSAISGVNLTVTNTTGYSLNPNKLGRTPGRFALLHTIASADLENNTLIGTSGIEIETYGGAASATTPIKVLKNSALNIDGRLSDGGGSFLTGANDNEAVQFVQLNGCLHVPGVDIGWNQVVNLPGQSRVEDNISIFKSSGTPAAHILIHDNFIQGAYPADAAHATAYSGGGIMLSDGTGATLDADPGFVDAYNNIVISTSNYGLAVASGHDNTISNNIVIASGMLPDGTRILYQNVGIYVWNSTPDPFFANNSASNNTVGFVGLLNTRNDYWLPDAPVQVNNVSLANPITLQTEHDYFVLWLQKIATAGVAPGAA